MIKALFKILGILITLLLLASLLSFAYHSFSKMGEKSKTTDAKGELVDVHGHQMHVYSTGEETNNVYVLLSALGTVCPTLDYKPLYEELKEDGKVFVIERFGYGYSEDYDSSRDIRTVLDETRYALMNSKAYKSLKMNQKITIVAHGEAFLEAIYWAQNYKDDIKAVIGLNPVVPNLLTDKEIKKTKKFMFSFNQFITNVGFIRFLGVDNDETIASGLLSSEEQEIYKAFLYKKSNNFIMKNELDRLSQNAEIVSRGKSLKELGIPMKFYISSNDHLKSINENYLEILSGYVETVTAVYPNIGFNIELYKTDKKEDSISSSIINFLTSLEVVL